MQLKYRGISYTASVTEDRGEGTERVGVYRRKLTTTPQPAKPSFRKPSEELIYRGVRYTR